MSCDRPLLASVLLVTCALLFSGCATTETTRPAATPDLSMSEREQALRGEVRHWQGTPHVLGGTTRRGVDCSGLVVNIYRSLFDHRLPRTTEDQAREGRTISRRDLEPGDLVFFRPTPKTRHVGIYLSDGEFVHASSSAGVTVSRLDEAYWRQRYWQSRRILRSSPALASDSETTVSTPAERSGW